jgi:Protoglobin
MTIKPTPTFDLSDAMATEAARAWQDLLAVTPPKVRQVVADVVRDGAVTLTEEFYARMLRSERATHFLDQERVQKRLMASLQRWMTDLFEVEVDLEVAIGRQIEVGVVHARIRLPIDLIPAGIRILKRGIRRRIDFAPLDTSDRLLALVYVSDLLHLADGLMNQAYFHDAQEVVRNDEAYRLVMQKRSRNGPKRCCCRPGPPARHAPSPACAIRSSASGCTTRAPSCSTTPQTSARWWNRSTPWTTRCCRA